MKKSAHFSIQVMGKSVKGEGKDADGLSYLAKLRISIVVRGNRAVRFAISAFRQIYTLLLSSIRRKRHKVRKDAVNEQLCEEKAPFLLSLNETAQYIKRRRYG